MVLSPHTVELLCDNFSTHERSTDQCSQFCIMCMIGGTYETRWIPFYKRSSNSTLFFQNVQFRTRQGSLWCDVTHDHDWYNMKNFFSKNDNGLPNKIYIYLRGLLLERIGHVNECPTMHYSGIPRLTQSMIAYKILTEYFWNFQ